MSTEQLRLREYQTEAIDAVFKAWAGGMNRPAVVLPTGAGKTVVFSHLIKEFREGAFASSRAMILVHRDELADQAIDKIRSVIPGLDVGKVKAGSNETRADVLVCSVQTLSRDRRLRSLLEHDSSLLPHQRVGLIITDECHHAAAVSYKKIYNAFPDALNVGFTATLARGDGQGLGSAWDGVAYSKSVLWMVSKGYLVDPRGVAVDVAGLDLASVTKARGDFSAAALGEALDDAGADEVIAQAYLKHASDRPGVVFTPTVQTAQDAMLALVRAGITAEMVSGETPRDDRRLIFDRFRTGQTQVLVNCMVLTEGFDAPWASCAVIARPTQSAPLYVQMVGRVLRTWPGKKDAIVLNLSGSGGKLRTLVDLEPGAAQVVRDGESLSEAAIRTEEELDRPVRAGHPLFELRHRDVEMFAGSRSNWLRTHKGVLFISGSDSTVFLWPERALDDPDKRTGTWAVCEHQPQQKWKRLHTGLSLEMALAWGESEAEDRSAFSVAKTARWRSGKPSDAQESYARSLGVWRDGMTKAEASDAISVAKLSRVFDHYL